MTYLQPSDETPEKLRYVDALRGLAVLGVVAYHVGQYGTSAPFFHPLLAAAVESGARGVQLFFVLSAFTLFRSAQRRQTEAHAVRNFLLRRAFRIVPMYWLALLYFGLWFTYVQPRPLTPGQVLSNLLLVHGFGPGWINSAVPGGWSVGVEVMFYCLVPALVLRLRSLDHALRFVVVTWLLNGVLALALHQWPPVANVWELNSFLFFYLPAQLPVFGLGVALFFAIQPADIPRPVRGSTLLAVSLAGLVSLILGSPTQQHFWFAGGFVVLGMALSRYPNAGLVNRVTIWLGRISFSLYLVHFAVLLGLDYLGWNDMLHPTRMREAVVDYALRFILVLTVSGLLATLFYECVEKPFQRVGKRLIAGPPAPPISAAR